MDMTTNHRHAKRMAIIAAAIATVILIALLSSCSSGAKSTAKITLTANGGTGYEWVDDISQQQVLVLADKTTESDADVAGGPVASTYTLKAAREGTTTITFTLSRSWEPSSDDEYVTYEFTVDKGLDIISAEVAGTYSKRTDPVIS